MNNEFFIPIHVKKSLVADAICSAIESAGGINYWGYAWKRFSRKPKHMPLLSLGKDHNGKATYGAHLWYVVWALFDGGSVAIAEMLDDEPKKQHIKHSLDLTTIERGLVVMSKNFAPRFGELLDEQIDGPLGDLFIQCCLFGEGKYD